MKLQGRQSSIKWVLEEIKMISPEAAASVEIIKPKYIHVQCIDS